MENRVRKPTRKKLPRIRHGGPPCVREAHGPKYIYRSAPCLRAHQCVLDGVAGVLGLCFFFCLLDVCLHDDDNPIANFEPGVSVRNSLPLPGTPGPPALQGFAPFGPLGVTLDAIFPNFRRINSRIDFISDFSWIFL